MSVLDVALHALPPALLRSSTARFVANAPFDTHIMVLDLHEPLTERLTLVHEDSRTGLEFGLALAELCPRTWETPALTTIKERRQFYIARHDSRAILRQQRDLAVTPEPADF